MSGIQKEPLTSVITKSKNITSGTTMITRAPWPNGQYYRIRKLDIVTGDPNYTTSGVSFRFWDQDLSSTTTAAQGSGTSPVFTIGTAAITGASGGINLSLSGIGFSSFSKSMDQLPRIAFYAGITCLTNNPASVNLELEIV